LIPPLPLTNLYPRLTSFASLHAAALNAQRGKRYRPAVLAFNARLEAHLFQLQDELRGFTYTPGPYRQFEIRDPKRRLISAAPYRDRVVHHALDHRLVALPGITAHLRYVDDVALFANSADSLRQARDVLEAELEALRLRLHPIKSQIRQTRHGVSFVGFRVFPGRVRVRNHNLLKGKRRLSALHQGVATGDLSPSAARASLQSWNAHLAHGHTWRLRRRLFAGVPFAEGLP
jgi:retron-type reverse transcriptase